MRPPAQFGVGSPYQCAGSPRSARSPAPTNMLTISPNGDLDKLDEHLAARQIACIADLATSIDPVPASLLRQGDPTLGAQRSTTPEYVAKRLDHDLRQPQAGHGAEAEERAPVNAFAALSAIARAHAGVPSSNGVLRPMEKPDYEDLIEGLGDMVYTLDLEGRFTYINSAGLSLLGYPAEGILGRHFTDVLTPNRHDWRASISSAASLERKRLPSSRWRRSEMTAAPSTLRFAQEVFTAVNG